MTALVLTGFSRPLFENRIWTATAAFLCVLALVLSLAQWENLLLPINFVFFAAMAFSVLAVLLMNRHLIGPTSGRLSWQLAGTVLCGQLAMLSLGAGILQWFVNGLQMLLFSVRVGKRVGLDLIVYILIAGASIAAYLRGLNDRPAGWLGAPEVYPLGKFLLTGIGNSVVGFYRNLPLVELDIAVGCLLCLCYVLVVLAYCKLTPNEQQKTTGLLCLVLLGIGEQLPIGLGRISYGVSYSAASRYTTLTLVSVAAMLLLFAYCANRSRLHAAAAVLFGAAVLGAVAFEG